MWNKAKRLNLERSPPSGQHGIAPFHRFHGGGVEGGCQGVAVHQRLQHYYPWLLSGSGEAPWRLGGEPRRIWQAAKGPSDTWSHPRVCPSLPSTPPEPGVKRGVRQTTIASIHMHVNKVTRWSSAAQSSEATQPGTPQQFWSSSSRTSPPHPTSAHKACVLVSDPSLPEGGLRASGQGRGVLCKSKEGGGQRDFSCPGQKCPALAAPSSRPSRRLPGPCLPYPAPRCDGWWYVSYYVYLHPQGVG